MQCVFQIHQLERSSLVGVHLATNGLAVFGFFKIALNIILVAYLLYVHFPSHRLRARGWEARAAKVSD